MGNIYILDIISYYLEEYKLSYKRHDLYKVLMSDPSYPSMASITCTMTYYGIASAAYKISNRASIQNIEGAIVHTSILFGHFFILKKIGKECVCLYDGHNVTLSLDDFQKVWDGTVLIPRKPQNKTERAQKVSLHFWTILLTIIFFATLAVSLPIYSTLLIFNDFLAFFLCGKLMFKKYYLPYKDNFCKIGSKIDCEYVASKQPLRNYIHLGLEDVGLLYFIWDILLCLFDRQNYVSAFIGTLIGSIFCCFLLAFQIIKIRKYCTYCIGIYLIILFKLIEFKFIPVSDFSTDQLSGSIICAIASILVYKLIKNNMKLQGHSIDVETKFLKLKRDNLIYNILSSRTNTEHFPPIKGLEFGNKKGNWHFDMIVSLECEYCRNAINQILMLLAQNPDKFHLNIVLVGKLYSDINEDSLIATSKKELAIYELYNRGVKSTSILRDCNFYFKKEESVSPNTLLQYKRIISEVKKYKFEGLPVIYINGREKPQEYDITDYQYIYSGEQ